MTAQPPMQIRYLLVRAIVTLMTLVAMVAALELPTYRLPFEWQAHGGVATISQLADVPLPAALRAGDRITFQDQSARVRSLFVSPSVPSDSIYRVRVVRGIEVLTVSISTVPSPEDGRFLTVVNLVTVLVISLLGLVTLWRGKSWSAWGLTLFAASVLCGATLAQTPAPPFANVACIFAGFLFTGPVPFVGLYMTALDLTGRSVRDRPLLTSLLAAVSIGIVGLEVLTVIEMLVSGIGGITIINLLTGCLASVMVAIPLLVLASGYVTARADQKLRIRWVLASSVLLVPMLLSSFVDQLQLATSVEAKHLLTVLRALLTASIFSLYAYAVLSQRLVEVKIVVNRAVVFGALMMMVVGILGAVESLIERSALGASAGTALELAVPLALGLISQRLHRWIEATVDKLLFRSEHLSRAALRDFVRDAGFIESADVLVRRMVSIFSKHAGGRGAALFEWRGGGMECSAQDGNCRCPDLIDPDDPGLVRLRATLSPLDLHEADSALGADGLALPLALRGRIFGVLVCGSRAAGRYAQAEAQELGQAAHDVGASLFALRARANELLIERLAQGHMHADHAVAEARRLAGMI